MQDATFAEGALEHAADLPMEAAEIALADDARIVVRRIGGDRPRRFVVSHGNGLAVEGYRAFWELLLPDAEVVVFDFRNHGINPPAPPSHLNNWVHFVSDFDAVLKGIDAHFGTKPTYGVFHSMSALTCMLHASSHPYPWKGLVLVEPPAVPPPDRPEWEAHMATQHLLVEKTRTRRTTFSTPEDLARSFSRIPMFQRMPDDVRLRLAASTLRAQPDGGFRLACPPDFEADTFSLWEMAPHWDAFARIECPLQLIVSDPKDSDTPALSSIGRRLAAEFGFSIAEFGNAGHLVQLDQPAACAQTVRDFVARAEGRAPSATGNPGAG